jgi:uncharacterized protein DUF4446
MFISTAIAILALILVLYGIFEIQNLKRRFTAALGNDDARSLETTLALHLARVNDVDTRLKQLKDDYKHLIDTSSLASQKISIVRFNPFGDTGGDQSFSLAVLDAHDSGYILTSIHNRTGTRVYAKPVDFGSSKYTLSSEEQQALGQAVRRVPKTS